MFRTIAMAAIASLALAGCVKHDPWSHRTDPDHGGDNGGRTEEKLLLTQRSDWTVRYMGRENQVYDDGSTAVLEHFRMNCSGAALLFPLIISPADLQSVYQNDLLEFFSYEVKLLKNDASANPSLSLEDLGAYQGRQTDVWFQRHMHGTWILYVAELDAQLNLTGQYAEYEFTLQEETPTEAFKRWCGQYHVYDGYCGMDITVSSAEANYLYYIDGWETGPAVSQPMDGERDWVYARFADGKLIFYAQFLQVEQYDKIDVDEVFAGTYLTTTSDSIGDLDWEGVDYEDPVAYFAQDGEKILLRPASITFDNGYTVTYNSMHYSRLWFTDNGKTANWAFYNSAGVPALPADVTYYPGTRSTQSAPATRLRTQGTVHRDQLKPARTARVRKWTKN